MGEPIGGIPDGIPEPQGPYGRCRTMAIEVETKDCTMLGDAEIEEMADLCAEGPNPFGIGLISKQTEEWVLISTAREGGRLKGFAFFTLERIGGTPAVIVGLASIHRTSKRDTVLRRHTTPRSTDWRRYRLASPRDAPFRWAFAAMPASL